MNYSHFGFQLFKKNQFHSFFCSSSPIKVHFLLRIQKFDSLLNPIGFKNKTIFHLRWIKNEKEI